MNCFVTGAAGFLGGHIVRELLARGHTVKGLVRTRSDLRGVQGLAFERIIGDINDQERLTTALRGCDWAFHAAGCHRRWLADYDEMFEANASGTRCLVEAARAAGVRRIVHTSTAGTIAPARAVIHGELRPTDESTPVTETDMVGHYLKSKWLAERIARRAAREGAPVVVVNPTATFGPCDVRPSPTGQWLVDFLNRQLEACLPGGFNIVHVRDVAVGHILAAEKGRPGERYILGHCEGNWTIEETLSMLSQVTGIPAPTRRLNPGWAKWRAQIGEQLARFGDEPPRRTVAEATLLSRRHFVSPVRAIRELGLPQTPPETALKEAVDWYRANGYVRS
jgi:dihydroflavonol-4-reductase